MQISDKNICFENENRKNFQEFLKSEWTTGNAALCKPDAKKKQNPEREKLFAIEKSPSRVQTGSVTFP